MFRAVGVPISLEGRAWGVMLVSPTRSEPLRAEPEARLAGFTELAGTGVANAQARVELRGFAEGPAQQVFAAVTAEVGAMLDCDFTLMNRYHPNRMETIVGVWAIAGGALPARVGHRTSFDGRNVTAQVLETGRPTRSTITDPMPVPDLPRSSPRGSNPPPGRRSTWRAASGVS